MHPFTVNWADTHPIYRCSIMIRYLFQPIEDKDDNCSVFMTYKFISNSNGKKKKKLLKILPRKWRTYISKFRLSSHSLRI